MNKTIIITGASRGIGKETVIELSKNKSHKIYALSRDINKMTQAFDHLPNVHSISFDLNENIEKTHDFNLFLFETLILLSCWKDPLPFSAK